MRGQTTDGYIHVADWYATFSALAGVDPTDKCAAKANLYTSDRQFEHVATNFRTEFDLASCRHSDQ